MPDHATGDRSSLVVVTPRLGAPSETFVRRHVCDLFPGATHVVTREVRQDATWSACGPVHVVDPRHGRPLGARVVDGIARRSPPLLGRMPWWPTPSAKRTFTAVLDALDHPAVLIEFLDGGVPLAALCAERGVPVVLHLHGYDTSSLLRSPFWRRQLRRLTGVRSIVVPTAAARDRLLAVSRDLPPVHVIPCGVDLPVAAPARAGKDTVLVAAVGRLVPKKDPLGLLEAFRRAQLVVPNLRLEIIGDGPLRTAVDRFVHSRFPARIVQVRGAQPHGEVLDLLARADLFVQASRQAPRSREEEGLPVAVLEAMAAGLPVVASRHAGIPEAVRDGVTGCLVPEGDAAGLAAAIVDLSLDRASRHRLGQAGWEHAHRFGWEAERSALAALLGLAGVRR